ncbi:MAG: deoxyribose-phosphate aldolase [Anaerolineales bacterium]|nr:deoxyribose-phosphate aldolase [Anaerolineales bacterium]
MSKLEFAQTIDQTNLDPTMTQKAAQSFFEKAAECRFASVAILPVFVDLAAEVLRGTETKVDAAISYPLSAVPFSLKAAETADAVRRGADEIDYVMDVGALKSGDYSALVQEAKAIIKASDGRLVKAIIEMWGLTNDEVFAACEICCDAGVHFVKSSTGYKGHYALRTSTVDDAKLLLKCVGDRAKVKIAGGIREIGFATELLDLGVARLGTSSGVKLLNSWIEQSASG